MKKFLLKENFDSENLFNKVSILTEDQRGRISKGLQWTVVNVSDAVIIGGTALVHYLNGGRDLTPDLDFMVADLSTVKAKLEADDVLYKALRSGNVGLLGISVIDFNTDYLDSNVGNVTLNKMILKTAEMAKIGGLQVRIINPELLAIMKIELGRDRDITDGFALLQSGKLRKNVYLQYLQALKGKLQDYESLIGYGEMI
ncbi:MAG: nucleotidyltransferase [Dehalococcoidia bacterium]|jgi:predicted nucleotidyltransferase